MAANRALQDYLSRVEELNTMVEGYAADLLKGREVTEQDYQMCLDEIEDSFLTV